MKSRVPDIYIVGAQKSGTTTLFNWLAQHPEVYAHPLAKDCGYFSNDQTFLHGSVRFFSFTKDADKDQLVLGAEANAMYAPEGITRMHEMMPSAKLIAILRDPVDRIFSAYRYAVERVLDDRSLEQAVYDELKGLVYTNEMALQCDYIGHSMYAQQLKRIYQYYEPGQVKVVVFEELRESPEKVLGGIFEWIGVSKEFTPDIRMKNITKGGARSKLLAKSLHQLPSTNIIRILGSTLIPFRLRARIRKRLVEFNRIEKPQPDFPSGVRELLVAHFRSEIDELQTLTERDFIQWQQNGV